MRARTASRGSLSPASIMPSIAAVTASDFIFMKSVSVLSRSKTIARIKRALRVRTVAATRRGGASGPAGAPRDGGRGMVEAARLPSFRGRPDRAAQADLAVVDPQVESARGIAADPR